MDTDTHRFLFKEETHQIIGCAMEAPNTLGHGLLEKPYENALSVCFSISNMPSFNGKELFYESNLCLSV